MEELLKRCKNASLELKKLGEADINKALLLIKEAILKNKDIIILENKKDIENAYGKIKDSMIDRLTLNEKRIEALANSIDDEITPNGHLTFLITRPLGRINSSITSLG